jgi:uncharacterized protein GlcG (DUF336 family)
MRVNLAMSGCATVVVAMTSLTMSSAFAQGLISKKRLSAALAMEAVMEAVDVCKKAGYAVTAIVVDNEGVRQAVIRGDGATVHTLDSAYAKAYTAASLAPVRKDGSTKGLSERIAKTPGVTTAGLASLPNINFTPAASPSWRAMKRSAALVWAVRPAAISITTARPRRWIRSRTG